MNRGYLLIVPLLVFLAACGEEEPKLPAAPRLDMITATQAPAQSAEQKEKAVYVYSGDRYRDPFTPLGQSGSSYQADVVFDPQRATIKALVYGSKSRSAVLSLGSASYYVRGEQIYDVMGRVVEGYSAKVMPNKVILRGEAENVYELKLSSDREGL